MTEKFTCSFNRGVTFTAVQTDKSKYDLLTVSFVLPLTRENAAYSALLSSVLNRGTEKYPTMRLLAIAQEELYAANAEVYNRIMGECVCLTFSVSGINKAYTIDNEDITDPLLALLYQFIFCPLVKDGGFLKEYVDSEKKNQIDIIRSRTDNKSSYAIARCIEHMCKDEAYSVPADGLEEDVQKINEKNLLEFFLNTVSTAPVHIVYTGNACGKEMAQRISGVLCFSERSGDIPKTEVIEKADQPKQITEQMNMSQSKLSIGYRTAVSLSHKDWIKFLVFDEIFAASPTSKLFSNVREKMSLCYYCSPVPQSLKGILIIAAGIDEKDKDAVLKAVSDQLEDMKNGIFTQEDLSSAKRNIKSGFRSVTDTVRGLNRFYFSRFIAGVDTSPQESEKQVDEITAEDVISCAKNITEDTVYFLKGGRDNDN